MFESKNALKFAWDDVSYGVSKMLKLILHRNISCIASTDEYDYWSVKLSERLSMDDLDCIFNRLGSSEQERNDTLPDEMENENSVNCLGKLVCEHLLKEALHNNWEDSYCTKTSLWCLGTN